MSFFKNHDGGQALGEWADASGIWSNLDDVTVPGVYHGVRCRNAPFVTARPLSVEVIQDDRNGPQTIQKLGFCGGDRLWHRRKRGRGWQRWQPVATFATPRHFGAGMAGGSGYSECSASPTLSSPCRRLPCGVRDGGRHQSDVENDESFYQTEALSLWLNSDYPLLLDGWYRLDTPLVVDLAGRPGLSLSGFGAGRSGFLLAGNAGLTIRGGRDGASDVMLEHIGFATDNRHRGPEAACLSLHGLGTALLRDVTGSGGRFAYAGDFIRASNAGGHLRFEACRAAHFARGFVVETMRGGVPLEVAEGCHFRDCAALAVDCGFAVSGDGGVTLETCQTTFRKTGLLAFEAGEVQALRNRFTAHGEQDFCRAIALEGKAETAATVFSDNIIRLDGGLGDSRIAIDLPPHFAGIVRGNRQSGETLYH
ncbi:hypothetical protein NAC44_06085 [Allorhizobium sp. BGMRC 0089]|uniref:hypothetical protein n=1 Tax=Allorhizobium sonneratiae TaxID=2934936 RepID=UPI002034A4B7|nr:hypothetical protein [Allorhizobium sonneratiae]MCM2291896.1 hypothetical protein [Allorhizobium sonneratiae]